MSDGSRILAAMTCGAALGGLAAYLALTARGRHLTSQISPALEDLSTLLRECRRALRQAQQVGKDAQGVAEDVQHMIAGQDLSDTA